MPKSKQFCVQLNFAPRADKLRKRFPASTIEYGQGSLSERGMDLLRRLLALDPQRRITAEEALHHPWRAPARPAVFSRDFYLQVLM